MVTLIELARERGILDRFQAIFQDKLHPGLVKDRRSSNFLDENLLVKLSTDRPAQTVNPIRLSLDHIAVRDSSCAGWRDK